MLAGEKPRRMMADSPECAHCAAFFRMTAAGATMPQQ